MAALNARGLHACHMHVPCSHPSSLCPTALCWMQKAGGGGQAAACRRPAAPCKGAHCRRRRCLSSRRLLAGWQPQVSWRRAFPVC